MSSDLSLGSFPPGFFFGSSTAAHQVEGGNTNNDWWEWEHTEGSTAVEPSADAIDQFHRYREDFALLAELGHNAHRLSLEWSRIEPAPGEFSRPALDHYRRVLDCLAGNGLTAFVTLHHFTNPRWFAARGGWLADDAVELFARYSDRVARELGELMPWTCTINEPQIVALFGHLTGYHPPGLRDPDGWRRVTRTLIAAHRAVVDLFPQAGLCLQMPDLQGDEELRATAQHEMIDIYLEDLSGAFAGVQYYTRMVLDPTAPGLVAAPPADAPVTQMGWEIHPDGLLKALRGAARAGLPLVVTENGIATDDDEQRIDYVESHLSAVLSALAERIDVRGYLYWSSFDNFEWAEGYRPRFGLVGIDRDDGLRRVVRPSAHAFGRVARTGRLAALRG
jgi:beta-glucosidase